ncbi:MAG: hypothetical protein QHH75_11825 [Bacillota bacterium]|jgi:hypothetical protein|nr:hypothetical protein [Bacillota bacterium]
MYVWVFQGQLGEGKTFGMSVLGWHFVAKARRSGIHADLYANFDLQGAKPLTSYRDFYQVARSEASICLLDEAHVNLDARLFHRGANIYMTQFFFYLRKLSASLFMTTPHIRNLDSRMRQLTNILVDCHKITGGFLYEIYDYQSERLLRRKFLPIHVAKQIFATGMYDSHAIIRAVEFPSNERAFDRFLDQIIEIREGSKKLENVENELEDNEEKLVEKFSESKPAKKSPKTASKKRS